MIIPIWIFLISLWLNYINFFDHLILSWKYWLFHVPNINITLRGKYPYLELFWSAFSCIRTEYGKILRITLYSVQMRKKMEQKNSEYWLFSRSYCNPVNQNTSEQLRWRWISLSLFKNLSLSVIPLYHMEIKETVYTTNQLTGVYLMQSSLQVISNKHEFYLT